MPLQNDVELTLKSDYPNDVVEGLVENYHNAIREYKKRNWQYFGNEIGQFIECARRMVQVSLHINITPLSAKLPNFTEKELISLENANGDEVYRIVLPRILYSMYCIRNKRGMIHKNQIDPNEMDASYLLYSAKWVFSEFFRLSSKKPFEETLNIINSINCKEFSAVWHVSNTTRVLLKLNCTDKVLCLLYINGKESDLDLFRETEYKNLTRFKSLLRKLHKELKIHYNDGMCEISPVGIIDAEVILIKSI